MGAQFLIEVGVDSKDLKSGSREFNKFEKNVSKTTKQTTKNLKSVDKEVKKTSKSFSTLAKATVGLLALNQVNRFAKESIRLFNEQARVEKSLEVALGRVSTELLNQATALQQLTLFGDEQTIQAQAFFAQMGLEEDQIKRLIPITQDFAAAKGIDLKTASDLVAKSVGSSTNALSRYGIVIEGAAGSQDRVTSAVNALSDAFGGQAQAAALAGSGSLTQLGNTFGDLQETIGGLLVDGLNPFVGGLTSIIQTVNEWIKVPAVENIKAQQNALNTLVIELSNSNTGEDRRRQIITELNKTYPKFLENLNTENLTTKALSERLKEFNEAFFQKIVLQGNQDALQEQINQKASIELENLRLARDLQSRLVSINEKRNFGLDLTGKTLAEQIELISKLNNRQVATNNLFSAADQINISLQVALAKINSNKREQVELDKQIGVLTVERNLLLQNTNADTQQLLENNTKEIEQRKALIALKQLDIQIAKTGAEEAKKGEELAKKALDKRLKDEEKSTAQTLAAAKQRMEINLANQLASAESAKDFARQSLGIAASEATGFLIKSIIASIPIFPLNVIAAGAAGAIIKGLFSNLLGFQEGGFVTGFTGQGSADQPAGLVHGGEVVIDKPTVQRIIAGDSPSSAIASVNASRGGGDFGESLQNIEDLLREDRKVTIINQIMARDFSEIVTKGDKDKNELINI